ncbi:c-type cytochrome [Massilia sp. PAMC28688]|uniref:c-type cytochrome n=1 Tax=Massilia sp. PAMC28688 TaxID=2861283 RepID=UPI001E3AA0C1|nr:c-type cytochrome [Massilia sp. PAMC28688]
MIIAALAALLAPAVQAADGAALYQQNCAACHGASREGALGPSLADASWVKVRPEQGALAKFIETGSPTAGMPAFKSALAPDAIRSIAQFLLKPAKGAGAAAAAPTNYPELANFKLPPGFSMAVYSDKVPAARGMVVSPAGIVYVGSGAAGKVYALVSSKGDHVVDKVVTVAEGLDAPIGVTLMNGALYVAEISRLIRFDQIDRTYDKWPAYEVVKVSLPKDKWHGGKVVAAGPDGKLYIPVGAPCNVCNKENEPYAKIFRMNPDGSGLEEYARGIRNSVGLAFHPVTRQLWFTDNGRDMLGDNVPSDKLDVAPRAGMHFGFPFCAGGVLPDPEFGAGRSCAEFTEPVAKLGPHVAALGLAFNTGEQFPSQYKHQLFIAQHGSWNRAQKSGYRVGLVTLHDNKLVSDTVFIDGFIQNDVVIGRPVAIAFLADGSMLVSDDFGGRIYRVSYQAPPKKE